MAKLTHIKDILAGHKKAQHDHEIEKIHRLIASAVNIGHKSIPTHGLRIDQEISDELQEAGFRYIKHTDKIEWGEPDEPPKKPQPKAETADQTKPTTTAPQKK